MISLKDMPLECRPREKAIKLGIKSLGNDELVAILLRTGYKDNSVKIVANKLLKEINGLNNVEEISISRLAKIKGIGITKAVTILAALELANRLVDKDKICKININNSYKVFECLKSVFSLPNQEQFVVLLLDHKKNLIDQKIVFIGSLDSVNVHPREIFKYAIVNSASSIIVAHNHPSGDVFPSKNDLKITRELVDVGVLLQIPVIDHFIIGHNNYYSFYENGEIK